jgi:hypothetical protein
LAASFAAVPTLLPIPNVITNTAHAEVTILEKMGLNPNEFT